MQTHALGETGVTLTTAGFGCAALAGMYQPCTADQAQAALQAAWDGGIRYFDVAPFYGSGVAEERLGAFLADKPRDSFAVSTKVGRLLHPVAAKDAPFYGFLNSHPARVRFDYSGAGLLQGLKQSLNRLRLDRIDVLLVHDIGRLAHDASDFARHWQDLVTSGLPMLAQMKAEGLIRAWGLGVNEVQVCLDLIDLAPPDVILLANRWTLLDRRGAPVLRRLAESGGRIVAGGVFNSGILATGAVEGATFDYAPASAEIRARVSQIDAECQALQVDRRAAALQFPLSDPVVASVLIGAAHPDAVAQNLAALKVPVPPAVFEATEQCALSG
jgi:D-threo-aldose 1-dehydrogenase